MTAALILLIKSFLIAWFILNFEPFNKFKEKKLERNTNFFIQLFVQITSCMKCTSFWTALIITQNFYLAAAASLIGWLFSNLKIKLKLM